jgi:hypothetical protein
MSEANSSALAVVEPSSSLEANVGVLMRRASDVAGVCREIVTKTAQTIQGRKYVRVEGWQAIAVAYGLVASSRDVEVVAGGVRAIGEVRRMSDGAIVSTAEGFVGEDEPVWFGGVTKDRDGKEKRHEKRPMYAIRAMAQTRSISRACRGALSFVVTLIDGGLSTTPAEEMDGVVVEGAVTPPPPAVRGNAGLKAALRPAPTPPHAEEQPPPHTDADFRLEPAQPDRPAHVPMSPPTHDREFVMPFANKKGEPLHLLSEKSLAWFRNALTENVANPDKARFRDEAARQLALIVAEMKFRGMAA